MEQLKIKGQTIEYVDDSHTYLVDGIIVPSITQLLKVKFGNKYRGVSKATLKNASIRGTAVHKAIEEYCTKGIDNKLKELHNYKWLSEKYKFKAIENEKIVILFENGEPISAGRLDLVLLDNENKVGIGDIKCTSTLDKNYLAYQLNLYRIAYMQTYEKQIDFLRGIHLKDDKRKYVDIPINEDIAWELIKEYQEGNEKKVKDDIYC